MTQSENNMIFLGYETTKVTVNETAPELNEYHNFLQILPR